MTESDDNRPHAPGIQVWAVLAGLVASGVLYFGAVLLIVEPIQKAAGRSPEAYMGVAFLVLAPACLFLGSILTGYLAAAWAKKPLLGGILRAPGLYIGVLWLLPDFSAGTPRPIALAIGMLWFAASWLGVLTGEEMRSRVEES